MKKKKLKREEFCELLEKVQEASTEQLGEILEEAFDALAKTSEAQKIFAEFCWHVYLSNRVNFEDAVYEYINVGNIVERRAFIECLGAPTYSTDEEVVEHVKELLKRML